MLRHHGRYPYSAIIDRPDFSWPENKRLAIYIAVNLECFPFGEGTGATLTSEKPKPDVLNYAWRDYGNRVGVWRMLDLFDELDLPSTALINSEMYTQAPRVVEAFRERGDEISAHGRTNAEKQGQMSEGDESALIAEATQTIKEAEGATPKGWLGPWISESEVTPDLLQEAGYDYLLDWSHDDQPVWMKTRRGRILSVPYPQELNDIPQIVNRQKEGRMFADMILDAYATFEAESAARPLVMGIALHPYIIGQAHRLPHLARALKQLRERADERVWFTTAGAISDHFRSLSV